MDSRGSFIQFDSEYQPAFVNNDFKPIGKIKTSYGGGFRMFKKTPAGSSKTPNFKTADFFEELNNKLKPFKENAEKNHQKEDFKSINHHSSYKESSDSYDTQDNLPAANINNLQDLQHLKEKNSRKIVELQAEYNRKKYEEQNVHKKPDFQTKPLPKPKKTMKKQNFDEYQKKFQEKFEKYLQDKNNKKNFNNSSGVNKEKHNTDKDQKMALKWFFRRLDKKNTGLLTIDTLLNEIYRNPDLALLFGIPEDTDYNEIENYITKTLIDNGLTHAKELTVEDFLYLSEKSKPESALYSKNYQKKEFNKPKEIEKDYKSYPCCLLSKYSLGILENIFFSLDSIDDLNVNKSEFIQKAFSDKRVQEILENDAVGLEENETLNLKTMLEYIENDKSSQSNRISWPEFITYFFVNEQGKKSSTYALSQDEISHLESIFNTLTQRSNNKVSSYDLIQKLLKDNKINEIKYKIARTGRNSSIPEENVEEVIMRIQDEAEGLISWKDFISYFSDIGYPLETQSPGLQTKNRYDDNSSQEDVLIIPPSLYSPKSTDKENNLKPPPKPPLTMPEPFDFEIREGFKKMSIREKRVQEMIEEKKREEEWHLNYRVKPKDVPLEVTTPMLDKIVENQRARSEEIKRTSIEVTKMLEKPFKVYLKNLNKQKPDPPQPFKYSFKAKPIPRSCTVPLFSSMNLEKENLRKERIASLAQKSLRESSLPPRMKMHQETSFKKIVVDEIQYKFKAKDPPNFQKLQEQFKKTLEAKKKACMTTKLAPFSIEKRAEELREKRLKDKQEKLQETQKISEKNKKSFKKKEVKDSNDQLKSKMSPESYTKINILLSNPKNQETKEEVQLGESSPVIKPKKEKKYKFDLVKTKLSNIILSSIAKKKENGEDLEEKLRIRKENERKDQIDYRKKIQEINEKVNHRPLLVETATDLSSKNKAKGLVLLQIKKNLEESGINTEKYFTEEEKKLLKDIGA
jgi:Uncharacterised protein family UPF0564